MNPFQETTLRMDKAIQTSLPLHDVLFIPHGQVWKT